MGDRRDHPLVRPNLRDQEHVGALGVEIEDLGAALGEHGGRERPEALPELDLEIHHVFVGGVAGVGEDAPVAQRARAKLHAPLEPPHDVLVGDELRGPAEEALAIQLVVLDPVRVEVPADLLRRVPGAPVGVRPDPGALVVEHVMVDERGHAHRAARIPRGGLHEESLEGTLAQQTAVGHAVERHASGHAEILLAGDLVQVARHAEHDLFRDLLHARRDVPMALLELRLGLPRRPAEQPVEALVGHREAVVVGKVLHVHLEAAVLADLEQLFHDQIVVFGLPVGGRPHDLVLRRVHLEAEVVGERAVEQPEGMGEPDLLEEIELVPLSRPVTRRRPLSHAVDREDRRFPEGAHEETARGVRLVVLDEEDLPLEREVPLDVVTGPEFLGQPDRDRLAEGGERPGKGREIGHQDPLELHERLVVETHVVEVLDADAAGPQAVVHRMVRETGVMLLAREALLRRGRDHLAVPDQARRRVVVER